MFWALLLQEATTMLILFWTELGQAENFLIAPRTRSDNFNDFPENQLAKFRA